MTDNDHENQHRRLVTAETFRQARLDLHLTLEQVASRLGVSRSTVAGWERHGVPMTERNIELWLVRKS